MSGFMQRAWVLGNPFSTASFNPPAELSIFNNVS